MNIAFISSEVTPFARTGGLGDVAGALPRALAARGHTVSVITPLYRSTTIDDAVPVSPGPVVSVPMKGIETKAGTAAVEMAEKCTAYFIAHAHYFERSGDLYGAAGKDFPDNCERFTFFSKAALELLRRLDMPVDVVHCNDWQSALAVIYLDLWYRQSTPLGAARSVFTIHNLAYQGLFPRDAFEVTGLPAGLFAAERGVEFYGGVNLLKGGILFADTVTTVSPTYAKEITTGEAGFGLDGVLRSRGNELTGILNGIDASEWDPASDGAIPARYSAQRIGGKRKCKRKLQEECGLPVDGTVPLAGMIGRFASQKGFDLVKPLVERTAELPVQFVILGKGEKEYERLFADLASALPERFSVHSRFDNDLAHRIEAGADLFLMPSRYEPCGLNQMYSLRYGTVPVVRRTGGLADTVVDYDPRLAAREESNGFVFDDFSVDALEEAFRRALDLYPNRRKWLALARNGMTRDWSWDRSAAAYEKLYRRLVSNAAGEPMGT